MRWKPHVQFLVGGNKTTYEVVDDWAKKKMMEQFKGTGP